MVSLGRLVRLQVGVFRALCHTNQSVQPRVLSLKYNPGCNSSGALTKQPSAALLHPPVILLSSTSMVVQYSHFPYPPGGSAVSFP
ncbi:hypothetical protein AGOR_G00233330 [Albula goreensis]|uniref:Uncharacterized protein n=1 Tax=Albula goreensis TaxID=1534307 RepID=A0A8T3CEZ1_9TELE|nr:hypothetical protein AGOR_G00233330 [Albula goreensis]